MQASGWKLSTVWRNGGSHRPPWIGEAPAVPSDGEPAGGETLQEVEGCAGQAASSAGPRPLRLSLAMAEVWGGPHHVGQVGWRH